MDNNAQDRIDAYIRGEMNASERALFSKELSNNLELRKDYEFTRHVAHSISDREQKKLQIKKWNRKTHNTRYTYSAIIGIAAMLVVGLFLFPNMPSNNPITEYESTSSFSAESYYTFTEIGQLIAERDYEVALQYIEDEEQNYSILADDSIAISNLTTITENIYELKWFKVQALLGLKRVEEACGILKEISNSDSQYKEKADSLWMELHHQ